MDTDFAQWAHIVIVAVVAGWFVYARIKVYRGDQLAGVVPALVGIAVLTLSDHFVSSVAPSPYFDSSSSVLIGAYFLGLAADAHVLIKERRSSGEG